MLDVMIVVEQCVHRSQPSWCVVMMIVEVTIDCIQHSLVESQTLYTFQYTASLPVVTIISDS